MNDRQALASYDEMRRIDCEEHLELTEEEELIEELRDEIDGLKVKLSHKDRLIAGLLDTAIGDIKRKIKSYAKLAAGETFDTKPASWYEERIEALNKQIEGLNKTKREYIYRK